MEASTPSRLSVHVRHPSRVIIPVAVTLDTSRSRDGKQGPPPPGPRRHIPPPPRPSVPLATIAGRASSRTTPQAVKKQGPIVDQFCRRQAVTPRLSCGRMVGKCMGYTLMTALFSALVAAYWVWPRDVKAQVTSTSITLPQLVLADPLLVVMELAVELTVTNENYLPISISEVTTAWYHDVPQADSFLFIPSPIGRVSWTTSKALTLPGRDSESFAMQARLSTEDGSIINLDAARACSLALSTGTSCPVLLEVSASPVFLGLMRLSPSTLKLPLELRLLVT